MVLYLEPPPLLLPPPLPPISLWPRTKLMSCAKSKKMFPGPFRTRKPPSGETRRPSTSTSTVFACNGHPVSARGFDRTVRGDPVSERGHLIRTWGTGKEHGGICAYSLMHLFLVFRKSKGGACRREAQAEWRETEGDREKERQREIGRKREREKRVKREIERGGERENQRGRDRGTQREGETERQVSNCAPEHALCTDPSEGVLGTLVVVPDADPGESRGLREVDSHHVTLALGERDEPHVLVARRQVRSVQQPAREKNARFCHVCCACVWSQRK